MYLVLNITNYNEGFQLGGAYRSYNKAVERLEWLESQEEYNKEDEDSWRIVFIKTQAKTAEPYTY